ncbi:hypothetical protein SprV_0200714700 [Sparganum proliferum]
MLDCSDCEKDNVLNRFYPKHWGTPYYCRTHGEYRAYQDNIRHMRLYITLLFLAGIVPFSIMLLGSQTIADILRKTYIIICGATPGCIILTLFWSRLTGSGIIFGYICSSIVAAAVWLLRSMTKEDDPDAILDPVLLQCTSCTFIGGFVFPTVWCLFRAPRIQEEDEQALWTSVQNIDNPLTPWPEVYCHELDMRFSPRLSEGKPTLREVRRSLKLTRRVTLLAFLGGMTWFIIFWPVVTFSSKKLTFEKFDILVVGVRIWNAISLVFCVIIPVVLTAMERSTPSKMDETEFQSRFERPLLEGEEKKSPFRRFRDWIYVWRER